MRASFMTEVMKQKSQKTGTNTKMFDNTEYTKKVEKLIECNDPEYKMLPADYPLWKSSRVIETIDANGSLQKTLVKVDPKTGKKKRCQGGVHGGRPGLPEVPLHWQVPDEEVQVQVTEYEVQQ